ncbi:MAG: LacI family DNA-binding transcriptional regulator [Chloroflexi bacterium]|nr:LacI family DNA-binding transcriptional regulator [Chloroflexota bacterium]
MAAKRRATSQDVAARAGVSRTTVSLVLNGVPNVRISEKTRARVFLASQELEYYPDAAARSLVRGLTQTLGVILCQTPDRIFADAFLPEVLRGIGEAAQGNGFRVLLQSVEDITRPAAYLHLVREKRIDGIILSGPRADDQQLLRLREEGFPVVLLGQLEGSGIPFVDVDNIAGAKRGAEHLLSLGHRRIGLITNAPLHYTASAQRLLGYRQALEEWGIGFDSSLVRYGDFHEESGKKAMAQLLDLSPPPTAVFVASDLVAFGAMEAIKSGGLRIPQDTALVGFDDVPLARYVDPPLTTIRLPAYELGARAAAMLLDMIQAKKDGEGLLLDTELVVRESCGLRAREAMLIE